MTVLVTIGDFSRMTHLSVKALRHYHDVGLLEPADVDPGSGYRLYDAGQVPVAQVIRRFRDLGMPIDEVRSMLEAPDLATRNQVIISHLGRMESQLAETAATVTSLRAMLENPGLPRPVEYRSVGPIRALAVASVISVDEFMSWWADTFRVLRQSLSERGLERSGPDGALYPAEFFETERGEVVAFIPVTGAGAEAGLLEIPAAELAVTVHAGGFEDLDHAYGSLGTVVASRGIGIDGPIREHYVFGPFDGGAEADYVTEVCWPVFRASPG